MPDARGPLLVGERAPDFVLPREDGAARFYAFVGGRPSLLVLTGDGTGGPPDGLLEELARGLDDDVPVHVVAGPGIEVPEAFRDDQGGLHEAYGVALSAGPTAFVLDANVRVAAACGADPRRAVDAVQALRDRWSRAHDDVLAPRHAPVLWIPDALDAQTCEELVARCTTHGVFETGVETTVAEGRVDQADRRRKRRLDHTVEEPELLRHLTSQIGRRVLPELSKAFAYKATRFEGFKIGCYPEDRQGFFEAHRDNLSSSTAHRRFALSLGLNDDFDGGELRFPEYGPARYRLGRGEALVFSGTHLHEVLPVTEGERYVLLSFLYGEDAVRARR
jgi:predicted 2-oxoglutarate/Fe(II)-dependent dioxygenase YbiX